MGMKTSNPRPVVACDPKEDLAKQSFKAESDINGIVMRFQKTGLVTHLAKGVPQFVDASAIPDYQETLNKLSSAREFFAGLPSNIRSEFDNNVAVFLDAVTDPAQIERLMDLGLEDVVDAQTEPQPAPTPEPPPEVPPAE